MDPRKKEKRPIIQSIYTGSGKRIYLPPRKKKIIERQPLILRLVIDGPVPSKKNLQIATINWRRIIFLVKHFISTTQTFKEFIVELRKVRPFIRYSPRFVEWEEKTLLDLQQQAVRWWASYQERKLIFPITKASISIYHYWADNRRRDNSNKMESINDVLVSAGILTDDTWQTLSPIVADADLYHGEINDHITMITITAYDW